MTKALYTAALFLRAKFRQRNLLVAELFSPALVMLVTFVLGWSISTVDRFQVRSAYLASDRRCGPFARATPGFAPPEGTFPPGSRTVVSHNGPLT